MTGIEIAPGLTGNSSGIGGRMRTSNSWTSCLILFALFFLVNAGPANGTTYDLTTAGSTATDTGGGVIFNQINPQSTGTGLIDSFAQVGQPGGSLTFTQGYNTTVNNVLNNGASDNFNHALLLSSVPTVTVGGISYREFVLDINQTGASPLLSVDDIQVFLTNTGNQSVNTFSPQGALQLADSKLIYRMDGNGSTSQNDTLNLNYSLNSGSGSGDMVMLVPNSLFTAGYNQVALFSSFGTPPGTYPQNDGFEEWFVCQNKSTGAPQACTGSTSGTNVSGSGSQSVPEPGSMLLLSLGMLVAARRMAKQKIRFS